MSSIYFCVMLYRRVAYPPQGGIPPPTTANGGQPPLTSGHSLPDAGAKALPGIINI